MTYFPRPTSVLSIAFKHSASVRATDDVPNAAEAVVTSEKKPYSADFVFTLDDVAIFGSPFEMFMMKKDGNVAYQLKLALAGGTTSFDPEPYPQFNLIVTDEQDITKKLAEIKANGVDYMEMRTWEEVQTGFLLPEIYKTSFENQINAGRITLVKLPEVRYITNAAQTNEGDYLVCSVNYSGSYDSFRLFKGPLDNLQQQEILSQGSFGITYTGSTPEGKFYIPDPVEPIEPKWGLLPKWKDEEIKAVNLDEVRALIGDKQLNVQGIRKFKAGM